MTRKTIWAGALALATLASGAAFVSADPGSRGGWHQGHGRHGHDSAFRELNLTDEQKATFKDMVKQAHESNKPLFDQMRQQRQDLKAALAAGNADPARVGQLTIAMNQTRAQMKAQREQLRDKMVTMLTPDQKAKYDQLKQEREQRRQQMHERFQQKRDGQPTNE